MWAGFLAVVSVVFSSTVANAQPAPRPPNLNRVSVSVLAGALPRGRGVVLAEGGRILTALSVVQNVRDLRVRYPDGRVDHARVLATDPEWSVAVLEGTAGHWPDGIALAPRDARGGDRVSWLAGNGAPVTQGTLRRRRTYAVHNALLRDAWELDPVPARTALGSAILSQGALVSLVVAPVLADGETAPTGVPAAYGVPLTALRAMTARIGASAQPWIGLVARDLRPGTESLATASSGIRVIEVDPEGPAARAGIRAGESGDVITAADGGPIHALSDLGDVLARHSIGETITLELIRQGTRVVTALQILPRPASATDTNTAHAPQAPPPTPMPQDPRLGWPMEPPWPPSPPPR